jgi:hypothetical protein
MKLKTIAILAAAYFLYTKFVKKAAGTKQPLQAAGNIGTIPALDNAGLPIGVKTIDNTGFVPPEIINPLDLPAQHIPGLTTVSEYPITPALDSILAQAQKPVISDSRVVALPKALKTKHKSGVYTVSV